MSAHALSFTLLLALQATPAAQPAHADEAAVERGGRAFRARACNACHRLDGITLVGPPLNGIFGTQVLLADGTQVKVDEAYLRESIEQPQAKLVAGYLQPMVRSNLSEQEVLDLVAFIRAQTPPTPTPARRPATFVERGREIFLRRGCAACHGSAGLGPAPNPGAVGDHVPDLRAMGERMLLSGPAEAQVAIRMLERGAPAGRRFAHAFPSYPRFAAQLSAVRTKIEAGGVPAREDPGVLLPPLKMPAWGAVLTRAEVDAVVAYLITLQKWDE